MSAPEVAFCQQVKKVAEAAIEGRVPFFAVITNLREDLRRIRENGFQIADSSFEAAIAKPEILLVPSRGPLSEAEAGFMRDLQGFVDFAIRNGLSFPSVLSILMHDVGEIFAHGIDLEQAKAAHFLPKVTRWARWNAEPVGEVEEQLG